MNIICFNNSNPKKFHIQQATLTFQRMDFLDNPLNEFLIKFTLIFKNFSNNLIIKHSHFHALSYLILKKLYFYPHLTILELIIFKIYGTIKKIYMALILTNFSTIT